MKNRKVWERKAAKKVIAVVSTAAMMTGLLLSPVSGDAFTGTAYAYDDVKKGVKSEKQQTKKGSYVEGEVLALVTEDEAALSAMEMDLLSGAEELMQVDVEDADAEAILTTADFADSSDGEEQEPIKGTIKLIKSEDMTTQEILDALQDDARVICAEPNYRVSLSEGYAEAATEGDSENPSKEAEEFNAESGVIEERKESETIEEETASGQEAVSEEEAFAEDTEDTMEAAEEPLDEEPTTSSNFGRSDYTEGQIPDMTGWQWGNRNNGSLAGTYVYGTALDTGYDAWKEQEKEDLPEYVVGVIDSGIDETNPDLSGVLWEGKSFDEGGDEHGYYDASEEGVSSTTGLDGEHGTHVAGIIAAEWNGQGTSGVASNVKLMSLRFGGEIASVIRCLNYAKLAAENEVPLIAVNNSWSLDSCASDLVNIAVTELGESGVVSVFASGNESANSDKIMTTPATLANNPYAIVVDAVAPDGRKAVYSNYGIGTTDVCAPGSQILSTVFNKRSEESDSLQFMGEVNAHAPEGSEARNHLVSYTSFDDASVDPFDTFAVYYNEKGESCGSNLRYPIEEPAEGVFDGTAVLSVETDWDGDAGIISNVVDLSAREVKPHYVSFRVKAKDGEQCAAPAAVAIPVIKKKLDGAVEKKYKELKVLSDFGSMEGEYAGAYADLAAAEVVSPNEKEDGITEITINWEEFAISLMAACYSGDDPAQGTLYFDSIALGSCRYPFAYYDGTSMATPAATGVLSVIAGKCADELDDLGTPAFAEKLAALVKASAIQSSAYEDICATSAYVSVSDTENPGPAISAITNGSGADSSNAFINDSTAADSTVASSVFTITGYFMEDVSVSLDGENCEARIEALGNEKYIVTVKKPSDYKDGTSVITVTGTNGKIDRSVVDLTAASDEESSGGGALGLYDHPYMDLPAQITSWRNYDMIGYHGQLYVFARASIGDLEVSNSDYLFAYDPKGETWEEIELPPETLKVDGEQLKSVSDVTACVNKGKLLLLITGTLANEEEDAAEILVSLDESGSTEVLGCYRIDLEDLLLPIQSTLVSDGDQMYLVGGYALGEEGLDVSPWIYPLIIGKELRIAEEPVAKLSAGRVLPRVSYAKGTWIISGGAGAEGVGSAMPAEGVEIVSLQGEEASAEMLEMGDMIGDEPYRTFSSGALADGSFLLAGPENVEGDADTYVLGADGELALYEKRVYTGHLLNPASVAYNGHFYVLGTIAPSGQDQASKVFSYTEMDKATYSVGDALTQEVKSAASQIGEGMPFFSNKPFTLDTADIYYSLESERASEVVATMNKFNSDGMSDYVRVVLNAQKLLEDEVPSSDRDAILSNARDIGVGEDSLFWMDVSMCLQVGEEDSYQVSRATEGTEITMGVPDIYAVAREESTRTYSIFACHANLPESERVERIIPVLDTKTNTLRFDITQCSTYAIGYTDTPINVSAVSITGISKKIAAGKKVRLTANITPKNAANKAVTWSSGNKRVATVDANGVVKIKKNTGGKKVVITATAKDGSGQSATFRITSMKGAVKSIKLSGRKTVKAGKALKLKATVKTTKGKANKKLKWTSSNPKLATVSSTGKVKTFKGKKGKVKITAMSTDGTNKKKSVTIRIK